MGYFDSPKNRALWDKRLSTLREIRETQEKTGLKGQVPGVGPGLPREGMAIPKAGAKLAADGTPLVVKITLAELEELVRQYRNVPKKNVHEERTRMRETQREVQVGGEGRAI